MSIPRLQPQGRKAKAFPQLYFRYPANPCSHIDLQVVGYCQLCIIGLTEITKALYVSTTLVVHSLWNAVRLSRGTSKLKKKTLVSALTMVLSDITNSFHLYMYVVRGIA